MRLNSFFGLLLLLAPAVILAQADRKVTEGNKLYHEQKYDGAINQYQDALLDDPESERIQFNLGDALYQIRSRGHCHFYRTY